FCSCGVSTKDDSEDLCEDPVPEAGVEAVRVARGGDETSMTCSRTRGARSVSTATSYNPARGGVNQSSIECAILSSTDCGSLFAVSRIRPASTCSDVTPAPVRFADPT